MAESPQLSTGLSTKSLGGWLVLSLVFAAGCGGYGPSHSDMVAATKLDAVSLVTLKGGTAFEKTYPQGEAYLVDLSDATIDDELLNNVKVLNRISELDVSSSAITDEQFAQLVSSKVLGVMFKFDMSDTSLSDASLRTLNDAKQDMLVELNVKGSKVTPAGIAEFTKNRPRHRFGAALKVKQ